MRGAPAWSSSKRKHGKPSVPPPERSATQAPADAKRGADKPGAGSDLQAALQLAYGVFPPGYLKRAVLITDGVETEGDVLAEANRARGFDVKLFTVPYRRPAPAEVAVRNLRRARQGRHRRAVRGHGGDLREPPDHARERGSTRAKR